MPLKRVGEMLREAAEEKRSVAAINCYNYETIRAVITAGEALSSPVIVMLYPGMTSHISLSTFAAITKDLAEKSEQQVGLHLDHCEDFDTIVQAIKAGFHSVIVDASHYDYKKNVKITKRVVEAAKLFDADVEAEIGFVGAAGVASDYTDSSKHTDPDEAKRFVDETGVDTLAVAVGNAHGKYAVQPNINAKLISAISARTGIPLVLHGGSGIPDAQLKRAVKNGVAKVNFGTDFFKAVYEAECKYVKSGEDPKDILFGILKAGEEAGVAYAKKKIRLLRAQ